MRTDALRILGIYSLLFQAPVLDDPEIWPLRTIEARKLVTEVAFSNIFSAANLDIA